LIIGSRRLALIGVIGTVAAIIVLFPYLLGIAFPLPSELPITIAGIERVDDDQQQDKLAVQVSLEVFNPNDVALTVSKVDYDLFANGILVGKGQLDYTTIPVTGRPQFLPDQSTMLKSIVFIDNDSSVTDMSQGGLQNVHWKVAGSVEYSNAFITGQKEFAAYTS
jgi:hypothetical protein